MAKNNGMRNACVKAGMAAKKAPTKTPPTTKKAAADPCWPGYEPTPGKKPFAKGSCKPKTAKRAAKKKKSA